MELGSGRTSGQGRPRASLTKPGKSCVCLHSPTALSLSATHTNLHIVDEHGELWIGGGAQTQVTMGMVQGSSCQPSWEPGKGHPSRYTGPRRSLRI